MDSTRLRVVKIVSPHVFIARMFFANRNKSHGNIIKHKKSSGWYHQYFM